MKRIIIGLVAAALLAALSIGMVDAARGGKKHNLITQAATHELSYALYPQANGGMVVDYSVVAWDGLVIDQYLPGFIDLAVMHRCTLAGVVIQRTNRLYWSTNYVGEEGVLMGHWNTTVFAGSECTAVLVDVNIGVYPDWEQLSPVLSYTVGA